MDGLSNYLIGVVLEGALVGVAFWVITMITIERTSLVGALRAGLISEAIGNLPYLAGVTAMEPPTLLTTLIGGGVFMYVILRVGELTPTRAFLGLVMTYFFLVAVVACAPLE